MQMQKVNKIVAALIFIFTSIIYLMTVAPTLSLWDCGGHALAHRIALGHRRGAGGHVGRVVGRNRSVARQGEVDQGQGDEGHEREHEDALDHVAAGG